MKNRESLKDFRQDGDVVSLAAMQKVDLGERGKTRSCGCSPYSQTHLCFFKFFILSWGIADWASQLALVVKNLPTNAGDKMDAGLSLWSGRSPGGGHGNPLQYSCLENPHGQRSLAGYSPGGHTESDTTKMT